MQLLNKPYRLLPVVSLLLIIVSFFSIQRTIDIHLHDTYFVISTQYFLWGVAIIALLLTLLYELTSGILFSKLLTLIHIFLSGLALLVLALSAFFGQPLSGERSVNDWTTFNDFAKYNSIVSTIALVALLAQFLFILNIMFGVIHWLKARKTN